MNGKYTIELCRPGGEDTGIERVFERQDDLAVAHNDTAKVIGSNAQDLQHYFVWIDLADVDIEPSE